MADPRLPRRASGLCRCRMSSFRRRPQAGIRVPHQRSGALRQAEQIVRLFAVGLGLEVLVAVATGRNDHPYGTPATRHVERPLPALDTCDGFRLAELPARTVRVDAANVGDALMRIGTVTLVDALDLDIVCHGPVPEYPSRQPAGSSRTCHGDVSDAETDRFAWKTARYAACGSCLPRAQTPRPRRGRAWRGFS